jgi:hypothetical protein
MPTQISVKHCFKDVKVVRGKDWGWGDQDGGEGNIGVIVEAGIGSKWVKVKWSCGYRESYRIGHDNCYDLYFADEKDALLQEAMERFPSGCSYTDPWGVAFLDVKYEKQTPYFIATNQIALAHDKGLVYSDGLWAQKLSTHAVSTATSSAAFSSKPEIKAEALIEECKKRFPVGCKVETIEADGKVFGGSITGEITPALHAGFKIYDKAKLIIDTVGAILFFHALVDGESKWARIVEYKGVKEKQWYYYDGKQVFIECITATDFEFSYSSEFTGHSIKSRVHLIYAYKFGHITTPPLSGEALLEECKRCYPVGTTVKDTGGSIFTIEESDKYVLDCYDNSCHISLKGTGYLYSNTLKKWAEIVDLPKPEPAPLTGTALLEECKRRFPEGCRVRDTRGDVYVVRHAYMRVSVGDCDVSASAGYLYDSSTKKWATVLEPVAAKHPLYINGIWATVCTTSIEAVTEKTDGDGFNPTQIRAPLNLTISLLTDEED